jgi:uncharacterized protein (TIGR02265 family)
MELKSARALAEGEDPKRRRELHELLEHIEQTPASHIVKGMYVSGIMESLDARGVKRPTTTIHKFKDYPLRGYMELLVDSAVTLYPKQSAKEGLRSLGRLAIPAFATSIVGSVIMGTVGRSWELALKCVAKGYEVSLRPGKATVVGGTPGQAVVQLRQVWNFGSSYQVGVIEGLMQWCGIEGQVVAVSTSLANVDLNVSWDEKQGRRRRSPGSSMSGSAPPPA